jgi:hypothetical protein
LCEPIPLAVITKCSQRGPAAVAKQEETTRERVLGQLLTAQLGKGIDSLAAVNWFDSHQDTHLRSNLQHHHYPAKSRMIDAKPNGVTSFITTRIREPRQDSTSIAHSAMRAGAGETNSMNSVGVGRAVPEFILRFSDP